MSLFNDIRSPLKRGVIFNPAYTLHRASAIKFELSHDFVGHDLEPDKGGRPIAGAERHVGGVAAAADQDAADPRRVVARVESVPTPAEIGLEPGAEIHRRRIGRHADIAKIPGAIARRDAHAAAQGDGQMGKVAAHALALYEHVERRLGRVRVLVAKADMVVHKIADRLDPSPAAWGVAEQ